MKSLALVGASGHGKVVAEIAELTGWRVTFFDDAFPLISAVAHWPVVGRTQELLKNLHHYDGCFIAIGENRIRLEKQKLIKDYHAVFPTLIHPSATVSRYAQLGEGTVIMANTVINPFIKIGSACIVNTAATIDHDCFLEDGVHISPGAHLAGNVSIGECSWIGIGASVKQGIKIGSDVRVGAGAAVVTDVTNHLTVVGVPAKEKF